MTLIKSGGGTGPEMPGNLICQGAKSCGIYFRKMRKRYSAPSGGAFFLQIRV